MPMSLNIFSGVGQKINMTLAEATMARSSRFVMVVRGATGNCAELLSSHFMKECCMEGTWIKMLRRYDMQGKVE